MQKDEKENAPKLTLEDIVHVVELLGLTSGEVNKLIQRTC